MTRDVAFNTANFAYRQAFYSSEEDWGIACRTSRLYFSPIETFRERMDEMLAEIQDLGFSQLELWHFHLNQKWWIPEHVEVLQSLLKERKMSVFAYCGGFGDTEEEFLKTCELMQQLGISILAGATPLLFKNRPFLVEQLRKYGLVFAYENHPEKTPQEVLDKIGDTDTDVIGTTIDTGWYGTQQYPADQAIRELKDRLVHIHLKDVCKVGTHETCGYQEGVVDLQACVEALKEIGYTGKISVEHEPHAYKPNEDIRRSRVLLEGWL